MVMEQWDGTTPCSPFCGGAYLRHISAAAVPGVGELSPSQTGRLRYLLNTGKWKSATYFCYM